jgi:hypothetical protein
LMPLTKKMTVPILLNYICCANINVFSKQFQTNKYFFFDYVNKSIEV